MKLAEAVKASPLGYAQRPAPERGVTLYATGGTIFAEKGGVMRVVTLGTDADHGWEPVMPEPAPAGRQAQSPALAAPAPAPGPDRFSGRGALTPDQVVVHRKKRGPAASNSANPGIDTPRGEIVAPAPILSDLGGIPRGTSG